MKKLPITGFIACEVCDMPDGSKLQLNIAEQIKGALRTPSNPQGGADLAEIAESTVLIRKIFPAIDKGENTVLIENGEHQLLMKKINNLHWVVIDPAIKDWVDSLAALPDIEIKENEA